MFYTPETSIKYLNYRINLLTQRDPATNAKLIKALRRKILNLKRMVIENGKV